jgi:mono/diheme cytochrome c family protein
MDPSRDNLIIRFTTFWWALGTFFIFAVLLAVIWFFNHSDPTTLEDAAAKPRYATKAKIDAAQAANISPEAINAAIPKLSKQLAASKPVAVEQPAQLVPGSETAKKIASAPAVDTKAIDIPVAVEVPIDPAAMAVGKTQYLVCAACHGQNGEGGPIAPPLAGSEWVSGPVSNLIRIQLRGLQGPISVKGTEYNMPGGMAPLAYQTDEQVAGVITYIRNSFGNKASAVKAEQVAALRSEVGKPQVTAAELTQP